MTAVHHISIMLIIFQLVFDFIDSSQEYDGSYDLVTNFPRRVFSERHLTLEQAGLFPHASLFVQEK